MTSDDWGKALTRRVAAAIKHQRKGRTVQWVSDRTAELGHRVSRSRISDIEAGKRGGPIGVAELIVISAALRVSPVQLLFPDLPDGPVELLPQCHTPSEDAVNWFSGLRTPYLDNPAKGTEEEVDAAIAEANRNSEPLRLTRRRAHLRKMEAVARASLQGNEVFDETIWTQIAELVQQIQEVEQQMRAAGLTVGSSWDPSPWEQR